MDSVATRPPGQATQSSPGGPPSDPSTHEIRYSYAAPQHNPAAYPSSPRFGQNAPTFSQGGGVSVGGGSATGSSSDVAQKPKQTRKKKDPNANAANNEGKPVADAPKEKKPRKPRDPDAPPPKRRKKADSATNSNGVEGPQNSVISLASHPASPDPSSINLNPPQMQQPAQLGNNEAQGVAQPTQPPKGAFSHPSRPASSGQRYDPIRAASADLSAEKQPSSIFANYKPQSPEKMVRPSPTIASLLSPPQPAHAEPVRSASAQTANYSTSSKPDASAAVSYIPSAPPSKQSPNHVTSSEPMHLDSTAKAEPARPKKAEPAQDAPSPKPIRQKEARPPAPLGSGLLSNAAFGKEDAPPREYAEVPNQCIVIEVPMGGGGGNSSYVNFMKEVEQKYGFDVAHPRLAEHRRRMKDIAAAGAAIESAPGSADEMNLDRDSDMDSNAELGGMEEGSAPEGAIKKKRRKAGDEYDKMDDFIDDTEMIWEEQALASKDGYFVWSGPLVPEHSKPTVERADGTVKRGRGGRGRGGSTRGEGSGRGSRGGGRGSRGGATVRKPRVTKADRARLESEMRERASTASAAAKPSSYPGTTA